MTDEEEPDFTDPADAAQYAIGAAQEIAKINALRVTPAIIGLKALGRRQPRAEDSDAVWDDYFARLDRQETKIIDAIHDVAQIKLNIVAATLSHVVADFYQPPRTDAPGSAPWQVPGYGEEKAGLSEAIDVLAQIGLNWGNGFAKG
jgi:hypothetical protein